MRLLLAADTVVHPVLQFAGNNLLELVLTGIGAVVAWAIKRYADAGTAQIVVSEAAASAVAVINRELRPKLEAALADGVLTEKEKGELQHAALVLLKNSLAPAVVKMAQSLWGAAVDSFYRGHIERAVAAANAVKAQTQTLEAAKEARARIP